MIDLEAFLPSTPAQRKQAILSEIPDFNALAELDQAAAIAAVINTFIEDYIDNKVEKDQDKEDQSFIENTEAQKATLKEACDNFILIAENTINQAFSNLENNSNPKNIYELSQTHAFTVPNQIIRSLNAKLGLFWENLASLSPYTVNPETEFGLKIKGVDIIAKNKLTDNIEYTQIKTQKNTLTGSQSARVNEELSIHNNPVFAACFPLSSWTYTALPSIEKIAGSAFFDRIGIDYDNFQTAAKDLIISCEKIYKEKL